MVLSLFGCATELPSVADQDMVTDHVVVGQVVTVLNGERSRRYLPEMQFLELENEASGKRFQVDIGSSDEHFAIDLPPGRYQLNRVQVSEGPFRSMAQLSITFSVEPGAITYVGTWRFGVESPRYGRKIMVVMTANEEGRTRVQDFLRREYPNLQVSSMVERLPEPAEFETRLYEVMPYPRYPRYFRRHWW